MSLLSAIGDHKRRKRSVLSAIQEYDQGQLTPDALDLIIDDYAARQRIDFRGFTFDEKVRRMRRLQP